MIIFIFIFFKIVNNLREMSIIYNQDQFNIKLKEKI